MRKSERNQNKTSKYNSSTQTVIYTADAPKKSRHIVLQDR